MSSPSYASEDHAPSFSLGGTYPTHRLLVTSDTPDYPLGHFFHDADIGGVGFYPTPQLMTEAEVHIPSSPVEVVSQSIRINSDELPTPKSSLVDPSPITVATDTLRVPDDNPSPILSALPTPSDSRSFYPTRNSSVRVTSLLPPESLRLPPDPRRRIIVSSEASSNASSCDGDESEVTSEDSEDFPWKRYLVPNPISMATVNHRRKLTGSCEHLSSAAPRGSSRPHSVSPTSRGSPVDSYSEDDTVLVTRRRVNRHQQRSFFNLSPSTSMELVEFSSPSPSALGRSSSLRLPRERHPSPSPSMTLSHLPMATMSRTVPLSAITHTQ